MWTHGPRAVPWRARSGPGPGGTRRAVVLRRESVCCARGLVLDITVEFSAGVRPGRSSRASTASSASSARAGWASSSRRTTSSSTSGSRSSSSCPRRSQSAEVVARFVREARAAVKIKSEHVARVIDVGTARERRAVHGHGVPRGERPRRHGSQRTGRCRSSRRSTSSSRPARPSPRRTRSASSTATSSRRTSSASAAPTGSLSIKVLDFGISKVTTPGVAGARHDAHERASSARPSTCRPSRCSSSKDVDARDGHLVARRHPLRAPHRGVRRSPPRR